MFIPPLYHHFGQSCKFDNSCKWLHISKTRTAIHVQTKNSICKCHWLWCLGLEWAEKELLYFCLALLIQMISWFNSKWTICYFANCVQMNMEVQSCTRIGPETSCQWHLQMLFFGLLMKSSLGFVWMKLIVQFANFATLLKCKWVH